MPASYANDPQRAFVEYRKKVLGLGDGWWSTGGMTSIIHGVVFWRLYERAFGLHNFSVSEPQSYIAQMVGISSWWPF